MIDKVQARSYDPNHYQITVPSQFIRPLGGIGANWHQNNRYHTLVGYHPKVVINRYPSPLSPRSTIQALEIDCSLPKVLYGNNLYELKDTDFRDVCIRLASQLRAMGIKIHPTTLAKIQIKGVEYSKNILTRNIPVPYILQELYRSKPINNFMDVQRTTYRNDGEELTFYCTGYEVVFYDKSLEMQKALQEDPYIKLPAKLRNLIQNGQTNILRMEVRIHDNDTLKEFIVNRSHLATDTRFCNVYSQAISQYILTSCWNELTKSSRLVVPFVMSPSFELWKIHQRSRSKTSTQGLLAKLGLRYLLREHGYNGAKSALKRIKCSNPATYIRNYVGRSFLKLQKLDIWSYMDNMLSRFSCLDQRRWAKFIKGQTRGAWFYKEEPLLTAKEVGTWINDVTGGTIRRLIRAGTLKAKQIGKEWRIQRGDVLDYLNAGA